MSHKVAPKGQRAAVIGWKREARRGDLVAALDLLARSIELGHSRLTLYRYYYVSSLLKGTLTEFESHCDSLAQEIGRTEAMQIYARAADSAGATLSGKSAAHDSLVGTGLDHPEFSKGAG